MLAVIWGSSFLFIKVGVRELHPLYLTLGRVAAGAGAVLLILMLTRTRLPREPRVWAHLTVFGVVGVAVPFTLLGYGEQRIPSMLAGIWNATTPLFVMPFAALVLRTERICARRVVGILLGFLGVLVVLGFWQGVGGATLAGQLMCLGAAVCYGIAIPYQRRFLSGPGLSGLAVPAGQLLTAGGVLLVITPLVAGPPPILAQLSPDVTGSVIALGALGTGLAFVINFRVIRFAGASVSASVTYLIPIVATLVGVLALGERLRWHQPVGAAVVLAGVAVSQGLLWRRVDHAVTDSGADPGR
jgi:drug/metabolite transporter (DMT)-like permease